MGKRNKAAARDWYEEQQQLQRRTESLDRQLELLRYAAEKRKCNYPSAHELAALGFPAVADLVQQAYGLLEEAYGILLSQNQAQQP